MSFKAAFEERYTLSVKRIQESVGRQQNCKHRPNIGTMKFM